MDYLINCLVLEPLTQIFQFVYLIFHKLTAHYGISIILLSVFSSVLLVPLNRKIRETVQKEKRIEEILKPQIKDIRDKYKGADRNLAIKRLYSRYSYSPFYSVRSILGVLIQLPFMIGAYLMLKNNANLNGVSFIGISDLSQPDGLFFGFNLLPGVMLLVNVATAYFSSWFSFKEKITSVTIGIVFFIILYSAPACMLIYWTGNNIIQLVEALYKRVYVLKILQEKFKQKISQTITGFSFKNNEVKNFRKNIILLYVRNREFFFLIGLVILSIWWIVLHYAFKLDMYCSVHQWDANCKNVIFFKIFQLISFDSVSMAMTIIMIGYLFMMVKRPLIEYVNKNSPQKLLHSDIPFFICLIIVGISLVLIANTFKFQKLNGAVDIFLLGIIFCLFYWNKLKSIFCKLNLSSDIRRKGKKLYFPSVLILTGLVSVYCPMELYFSSIEDLGLDFYQLLKILIPFYIVLLAVSFFVYVISTKKIKELLSFVTVVTATIAVLYAMIFVPNFGTLIDFTFTSAELMSTPRVLLFQDLSVILISAILVYLLIKFKKLRLISTVVYVFVFYIYAYPVYLVIKNSDVLNTRTITSNAISKEEQIQNIKTALTFSKKENILVIILDAFTGGNIRELVKTHPELSNDLDGFTWYEDTMTLGVPTAAGAQSIISGDNVDPIKMQDDIGIKLANRISHGWAQFINYLTDKSFDVTLQHSVWLKPNILYEYISNREKTLFFSDHIGPIWRPTMATPNIVRELTNDGTEIEENSFSVPNFVRTYGFYSITPNSRKYLMYNNGSWRGNGGSLSQISQLLDWANLKLLEKMPTVDEHKSPQYKLFHFITTHPPYFVNSSCKLTQKDLGAQKNADGTVVGHMNTELCSLSVLTRLFKWMKANNVYDNTQIYITSDHGGYTVDDSRFIHNSLNSVYYALLLVKPKNSNGALKINSDYLMKNSDIALFIKHSFGDELSKEPYKNKERVRISVDNDWNQTGNTQNFTHGVIVRGSMFNKDNWSEVSDKKEIFNLKSLLTD